jgi:hypothetical protein
MSHGAALEYSGKIVCRRITHVLPLVNYTGTDIYVVLSIRPLTNVEKEEVRDERKALAAIDE